MKKSLLLAVAAVLALTAGPAAQAQTYSNAVMDLNPAGYWPLNETTPPPQPLDLTAANIGSLGAAGNGYYGAWYQPSGSTWYITNNIAQTNGITFASDGDQALFCQQQAGQYVIVPRNTNGVPNPAVTIAPPFTIETWALIGATNSASRTLVSEGQVPLNFGGPDTNNPFYGGTGTGWAGFTLGQYQDYFYFSCYCTNGTSKSSELDSSAYGKWKGVKVGQWVYVVATFDGTTETLWTNGVMATTKNVAANAAGVRYVPDPTSPLMIGSGNIVSLTPGQNTFAGALDEVAIYPEVLPQSSIQTHFETAFGTNATYGGNYTNAVLADNPILYYRLDDLQSRLNAGYPSGTFPVANNAGSLGAAANGVYQPGTTPGVAGPGYAGFGPDSKAVAINGWFGAVDVGGGNLPAALNPTTNSPLTVISWFQSNPADAPGRFQNILGHGDHSYRMALGQTAGENHFNAGPGPELQFASAADVATNGFAFNDARWHMVAGVYDGTNEYMYLDGVLARSATVTNPIIGSTNDLLLGGDSQYTYASATAGNTIKDFDGQIAQVAFWTNALSAADIQSLFDAAGVSPYLWRQPLPSSLETDAGQNVTIPAGIRGSAPVIYQWYQNGAPVAGQTNASLAYAPITTNNAGSYYLIAHNSFGAVTSSVVNIVVFGAPDIQEQTPADLQIFAGASPTLHVTAVGALPLAYQWSAGGTPIPGATNASYTVTNLQSGGTYACVVTNNFGSAAISPIAVTLLADPTAPFPATVLADGPAAYFRLDEASGTTAYDYAGGNNGVYTNVTLGQPGYTSLNPVQSDPTETAVEFGDYPPANNYAGDVPSYLNFGTPSGGNAEFTVEAWVTQYLYLNGGDCIVGVGYGNGGEQFVLDTGNGTAGGLRFFVRNAAGTVSAAGSTNLLANDGLWHHVVGVCDEAGGHVYLYLDGKQVASGAIASGSGILAATTPLSIGARESADYGLTNYDFQFLGKIDDVALYNKALSAGQVQAHYYASGIAPLNVQILPTDVTTNQGSTLTFTASAQGSSPLAYQWYDQNNNPITDATNATLTLNNLQQGQSGTYSVTVTNDYGTATAYASLSVVLGPPAITTDIQPTNVTVYAGDLVSFSILVSGSQPLYYQWYQDGSPVAGATNSGYSFAGLAGTNTYYCSVTNAYSYSQAGGPTYSSTATVVGVPVPTVQPTNFNSRLKITFAGYNRNETLQDFPVLVRLSTNLPGFSYAGFASPTGGDLRFADADGTRELPYEVDQWNDSNGVSSVWVQVPQLSGTNDFIWAYWGNPGDVTPPDYSTNGEVWVPPAFQSLPGYDVVYHLKEGGFPYFDSTLQYPALTGNAPTPAMGVVGNGQSFNQSGFLDAGQVNVGNAFTLSAWVNVSSSVNNIQGIWANGPGGYSSDHVVLYVNDYQTSDGALILGTGNGSAGTQWGTATGAVSFDQWHFVTAAVDRADGTATLYVDGSPEASGAIRTDCPTNTDMNLGRFTDGAFALKGQIDEARIQSGIESSNWVWASYMTVASNSVFSTYSAVTNTVPLSVEITIQAAGDKVILTWPSGTLQSAGSVAGPYNDLPSATSPYTNTVSGDQQFYRVRVSP